MGRAAIGMVFDRVFPASAIGDYARRVEASGLDQLWVIEDCFYTAGISLAATALAATERIGVGLGIMPAVARAVPITAMEIATLAEIAPGRFFPGIGHGVQDWMAQMGVRADSPLAALDETISAVKRLLAGDEVSLDGRHVRLDRVRLDRPPAVVPPIVAGVQQTKSLAVAGRVADGVILVEGAGPTYVRWALEQAGNPDPFRVVTFTMMAVSDERREAYGWVAPFVAGLVRERRPAFTVLPFFDEMFDRVERGERTRCSTCPPTSGARSAHRYSR
ncbi:MAG: LLM class flavin-dependent oxidoreductase [Ilumatobacteraceae bacterium]